MLPFTEIVRRCFEGPYIAQEDFDLQVFVRHLEAVREEYGIRFQPETPVPWDDSLADRVFQAGVEFYRRVGTYCIDTERMIRFSESEIQEALQAAPEETEFGEGRDRKRLKPRAPESEAAPWCFLGAAGAPVSCEDVFLSIVEGYGRIPLADSITSPTLTSIGGTRVRANTPLEILACITSSSLVREALSRADRPGLPVMNSIATASSDAAKIAGSQFGLRPSDGWLIGSLAELKITFERLNEVAYVNGIKGRICGESGPLLGGYCGGPEGVAIANVAYHLQAILVLRGVCHVTFPLHFNRVCNSSRDLLWAISVSSQAISRNSHFPFFTIPNTASGPVEEMCFLETAAIVASLVASGSSLEALGVYRNATVDLQTPQGPQFAAEVAHGVLGLSRREANRLVLRLLDRYERSLDSPPRGKTYQESYDFKTAKPKAETQRLHDRMKREISQLGVGFKR
ncbi:MAG: monomethylamine:corrinoid methyltransferase [Deltaproteobacteria bacterium]|nr:monomethylamine:corrinoid methyltransferase [Deltaproteobacteria bacterium]MBW2120296.1 monomethylamine:corrinoid methyltransferase [Deltaproteobacteria bacterium]